MKYLLILALLLVLRSSASPLLPALKARAASAREFARSRGFNTGMVLLVDLSLNSGSYRFFVVDTEKDSVIDKGLVTHGHCHTGLSKARFSNKPGCACSSEGRYRVGKRYTGSFGMAYTLHGLDATNSNAVIRHVVMHSHSCVPDAERSEDICQSEGCTTVSPAFLKRLQKRIDSSVKPVLMWVFG